MFCWFDCFASPGDRPVCLPASSNLQSRVPQLLSPQSRACVSRLGSAVHARWGSTSALISVWVAISVIVDAARSCRASVISFSWLMILFSIWHIHVALVVHGLALMLILDLKYCCTCQKRLFLNCAQYIM
jgi:hypothetical protein